jgi:predicted nicotinamide N-methyase
MKNGREKIGAPSIDWKGVAFGVGKNRRKTVGFGSFNKKERQYDDEFYIRELSIVDGGIGCALWDAAIILSRWIYSCQQHSSSNPIFDNKIILELGAGVGLPGICAARWARQCFLTDYLTPVNENLQYNVDINASVLSETDPVKINLKNNIRNSSHVIMLNWDHIWDEDLLLQDDPNIALIPRRNVDIILGSELTYTGNNSTINNLVKVIDTFLKHNGVFVEVLSDDRDGVSQFLEDVKNNGYTYKIIPVEERYLGNYGTKQRPETYKFYVFVRQGEDINNPLFTEICESMMKGGPPLVQSAVDKQQVKHTEKKKSNKKNNTKQQPQQSARKKEKKIVVSDSDSSDNEEGGDAFADFFINEDYELLNYNYKDVSFSVYHLNCSCTQFDLTGQIIWPSALMLNSYLIDHREELKDKKCIELGCGVGLNGITSSLIGCSLSLLTDDSTLPIIQKLVTQNTSHMQQYIQEQSLNTKVESAPLKWGNESELNSIIEQYGKFDIIIASDAIYNVDSLSALLDTIEALASSNAVCYVSYPDASSKSSTTLIELAQARQYTVQQVAQNNLPDNNVDQVRILKLSPNRH